MARVKIRDSDSIRITCSTFVQVCYSRGVKTNDNNGGTSEENFLPARGGPGPGRLAGRSPTCLRFSSFSRRWISNAIRATSSVTPYPKAKPTFPFGLMMVVVGVDANLTLKYCTGDCAASCPKCCLSLLASTSVRNGSGNKIITTDVCPRTAYFVFGPG